MEFTDLPYWIQTMVALALYLLLLGGIMLLTVLFVIGVLSTIEWVLVKIGLKEAEEEVAVKEQLSYNDIGLPIYDYDEPDHEGE